MEEKKMNKKAQQEMLGFVFVILLIVIIGILFLVLTLRQKPTIVEKENFKVNNLLNGILYYTTNCEQKNIQELIMLCGRGETMFDCGEENPCEIVRGNISKILETSLQGDYNFTIDFKYDKITISSGVCPGRKVALSAVSVLPNGISIKLLSCLSSS